MRSTTSEVTSALEASQNRPVHLVEVVLGANTYRMTDAFIPLTWNGNTYDQAGHFLGFSDIQESASVEVAKLTITLSAINPLYTHELLTEDYLDRPVRIYKGFLEADSTLIADPLLVFDGRIDSPVISDNPDDGNSLIALTVSNSWVDFERRIGRYTNHESQQLFYPGDMGFEFAATEITDKVWGKV